MTKNGTRPAVLVVDDEAHILSSMTALLEEDFAVLTSTNAEKALELLQDTEIEVIIADQRMPGLTGDEFLARAKERSEATRVLITGYADINALVRAVNHGQIYTYVAKPWDPLELKITVIKAAEHCRLMQEVLRERDLLHALMDNIPDVIWFRDSAGQFTRVNKAAASFLGVSDPSQVIGKSMFDFYVPEIAQQILAEEEKIIRLRRPETNGIKQIRLQSGTIRWLSTTKAPVLERDGRVAALVGVSRDVTEQKQAELALQQSEEKYRQIVETAAEGVWIFDEHFRTMFVNTKMATMLGCVPEEMAQRPVSDFLPDDDRPSQVERFEKSNSSMSTADMRLRKKDGSVIWTILASSPLLDSSGGCTGTLAMFTDVTERKALEEQFRQAQKLEAVGRFAGGVAHDFNNLLTVITGYSQLLLRRLESDSALRVQIEKIETAAGQAANLTRQLLSFSRRRVFQSEVVDLNTVVANFQKMCLPIIGIDVELVTRLDPVVGRVRADIGQLDQVLMNLVVNARDAMPQGGKLTIETANRDRVADSSGSSAKGPAGSYVLLAVSDTGCGMDADTQSHIFDPFFTTKEEGKGTGLGLSTVHGIVAQHGGYIEVSSEVGKGTCFSIYLPRVTEAVQTASACQESTEWPRGNETVLVVEDRAAVRELVRETLSPCGYKIFEAANGKEGLEFCRKHLQPIDLVITDLIMPGMNGKEFAELAKQYHRETKVLYMSGYGGEALAGNEAREDLLQKPFSPETLLRKIREVLGASRTRHSILVVDDDNEIRNLLRSILEEDGYGVYTAENGKRAVAVLKESSVNLMMTDLAMPVQEGLETIAYVRKEYPALPVVAMSGTFRGTMLNTATHLGASAVLEKPVKVDEVLNLVHQLLRR
jgi:two-component system cell cycle sensor histidine kinase/response regulator CckA